MAYATTLQLAAILNIKTDVPSWDTGTTPTNEEVGTGDGSALIFYLDQKNIIASSYILYYGAASASATAFTETTHYALDKTKGKVTLTTAGRTLLSTDKIWAEYSYINIGVDDAYVQDVLDRAELRVDKRTNSTYTDSTANNPSYPSVIEYQPSKGMYDRTYFAQKRPLVDVSSLLASDITASANSLDVTTGEGVNFPSTGTIVIGDEKITYTGVSTDTLIGLTRGVDDSTGSAHVSGDSIHTTVVESSGTAEGTAPTWTVLNWDSEIVADDNGKIEIYKGLLIDNIYVDTILMSKQDVANRIRITYLYGWDIVPVDITRLTLLIAKQMLIMDTIGGSLVKGRNEFKPGVINVDNAEIESILSTYSMAKIGNT